MKPKIEKVANFLKRFSKEIIVGLILAAFAAITFEYAKDKFEENNLRNALKAVAEVVTYDRNGNPLKQGSGFFITSTGVLVTNAHVIQGGYLYLTKAKLPSGAYYNLKEIIGMDDTADIAILQFDAKETPFIRKLGNSDQIEIGERIIAIGAPLGLESTVSDGVISYPKRKIKDIELIQFTAPISSGSSGGGLFDRKGRILGVITSAIEISQGVQKEVAQNLNFAVPINTIKKVLAGGEKKFTEESPDYFYSKGMMAVNRKDYDMAIEYFKRTIALDNKYADAYIDLGITYYEKGLYNEELKTLGRAVQLAPDNSDAYYYLGMAFEDTGSYDSAIANYRKVLEIRPDDKDAMYSLAILYLVKGQKNKALALIPKIKKLSPGFGKELKILSEKVR